MLNLDSRSKHKLLWIATLLVPAITVQAVRLAIGGGPAAASAATSLPAAPPTPAPSALIPEAAKPLSPSQAKALDWLHNRKQTLGVRSPMDRPDSITEPAPTQAPTPMAAAPTPSAPRTPGTMSITALMTAGTVDTSIVSINHKLFRVGDEIVPLWRILAIDSRARTVTIAGPDGQSITLSLTLPGN
jgi:hypothetical protein